MQQLSFPEYQFRFRKEQNKVFIFDIIRRKYVLLQPEEWVRQHVVHLLVLYKHYPASFINVEKKIVLNGLTKRYDVVVFLPDGSIFLVIECKAPSVALNQEVFDQVAQYNQVLGAPFLMVTNGLTHFFCQTDYQNGQYIFLNDLPDYPKGQK